MGPDTNLKLFIIQSQLTANVYTSMHSYQINNFVSVYWSAVSEIAREQGKRDKHQAHPSKRETFFQNVRKSSENYRLSMHRL